MLIKLKSILTVIKSKLVIDHTIRHHSLAKLTLNISYHIELTGFPAINKDMSHNHEIHNFIDVAIVWILNDPTC